MSVMAEQEEEFREVSPKKHTNVAPNYGQNTRDIKDNPLGNTPLFIKASDLMDAKGYRMTDYDIYEEISQTIGKGKVKGIQNIRGLWRCYMKNFEAKMELKSKGLTIGGKKVQFHFDNPFAANITGPDQKRTKVTIRGYPMSAAEEPIITFLDKHKIKPESSIKDGYMRDRSGKLTAVQNGSRFSYADSKGIESNPLPRDAFIGRFQVKIYHQGQLENKKYCHNCLSEMHWTNQCVNLRVCKVCKLDNHIEGDPMCEFYCPQDNIIPFGGKNDPESNMFPCDFLHNGVPVNCSEVAYFHDKAMKHGDKDLANDILDAKNGYEAKTLGKCIQCVPSWEAENVQVMEHIVTEKFEQVPECQEKLLNSGDQMIVEAVPYGDLFWGAGLDKNAAKNTRPDMWPGRNEMGKLIMRVRDKLRKAKKEKDGNKSNARGRTTEVRRSARSASPRSPSVKRRSQNEQSTDKKPKIAPPKLILNNEENQAPEEETTDKDWG